MVRMIPSYLARYKMRMMRSIPLSPGILNELFTPDGGERSSASSAPVSADADDHPQDLSGE
jgi:hypothetical protein